MLTGYTIVGMHIKFVTISGKVRNWNCQKIFCSKNVSFKKIGLRKLCARSKSFNPPIDYKVLRLCNVWCWYIFK